VDLIKKYLFQLNEKLISWTPSGSKAFFESKDFPFVETIESRWESIRKELDALLVDMNEIPPFEAIQKEQRILTTDKRWRTFVLLGYGENVEENQRLCPQTTGLLSEIPGLTSAMFSIFQPGKRIPPHRGPFKGVLRYHLGLRVPKDPTKAAIRVNGEVRHWHEGKSLIFDDTYVHEAWNESDETRVVLFVDFIRSLPFPLSWLNRRVYQAIQNSSFVKDAAENVLNWNKKRRLK
jgi:beta-hydroxylase